MIFAHGNLAMGELYAGMLQPVLHFGSLLPILALALWAAQLGEPLLWQLPLAFAVAALAVAAFFAVFHGHAHGAELPGQAGAIAYSAGFVLATGLIHLAGIAVGLVIHLPRGPALVRAGGAAIAAAGAWLLSGLLAA